jgi:hypothetical protein
MQLKDSKGHSLYPVSYRKFDKGHARQTIVRISNYWYCEECKKLIKGEPAVQVIAK